MFCCLKDLICLLILSFKNPHKDPKEPRRAKVQRQMWDSSHPCQFPCVKSWMQKSLITIERVEKSDGEIAIQCKAKHSTGEQRRFTPFFQTTENRRRLRGPEHGCGRRWQELRRKHRFMLVEGFIRD